MTRKIHKPEPAAKPAKRGRAKPDGGMPNGKTPAANPEATAKPTKSDTLIALLSRPAGARLDDLMKASGWQAHSVRGFLAGTLKKKLGTGVTSEKTGSGRVYRIADPSGAA